MISLLLLISSPAESTIRYVNASGSATGEGSSWENASNSLQAMIDASSETAVDTIFVAAGTYYPSELYAEIDAKARKFSIRKDVRIFGGFPATGSPEWQLRNPSANPTVLSGTFGTQSETDDSFHVVLMMNVTLACILDGVEITGGNAKTLSGSYLFHEAEIFNYAGGGLYIHNASPTISRCLFSRNFGQLGGAMALYNSHPVVKNCLFAENTAYFGSAIYNNASSANLVNCTIASNYTRTSAVVYNENSSTVTLSSTIVWGNSTNISASQLESFKFYYSLIEGYDESQQEAGTSHGNMSPKDPLFVNPKPYAELHEGKPGNYRLETSSPAINAGNPDVVEAAPTDSDLGGNSRVLSDRVDIGAYETILPDTIAKGVATSSFTTNDYVAKNILTAIFDLKKMLALMISSPVPGPVEVKVKKHEDLPKLTRSEGQQEIVSVPKSFSVLLEALAEQIKLVLFFKAQELAAYNLAFGNSNNAVLPVGRNDDVKNLNVVRLTAKLAYRQVEDTYEIIKPDRVTYNEERDAWEIEITVSDLGEFFITGQKDVILPVELSAFDVSLQEEEVQVRWKTTSETNASHFEVERSNDGSRFTPIGIIASSNDDSISLRTYSFTDRFPVAGINYYRLKTVDKDKAFSYSRIESISCTSCKTYNIFPNPAQDKLTLTSGALQFTSIEIFALNGVPVYKYPNLNIQKARRFDINLHGLSPGLYIIRITTEQNTLIEAKFLKE